MHIDDISIDLSKLEKGVYYLGSYGATGKSYLYKLLNSLKEDNQDILALTYDKYRDNNILLDILYRFNGQYIMLDKLDLYITQGIIDFLKSTDKIVLIDLKNIKLLRKLPVSIAEVSMYRNKIEVNIL